MIKPKAMFFDFDGTLLSTGKMPDSARKALFHAKEKGVLIFAATGRHKKEYEEMPWFPGLPFDGFVSMNGAYCYTPDKIIYKQPMNKAAITAMINFTKEHDLYCLFCEAHETYSNRADEEIAAGQIAHGLPVPPVRTPNLDAEIYQMVTFGRDIDHFIRNLPNVSVTSWLTNCYDIVPAGVNKWVGITPMIDAFGLKPAEIAAFGDGENDIEMLTGAGYAVAMGNGSDKVKAVSDYVTSHVDDDGILKAVKHILG